METKGLVAKAQIVINASANDVWEALVNPAKIKQYMFGADVSSDFKPNSKICFTGVWEGKPYEEKGFVLNVDKGKLLRYTTFNPQSEELDIAENYHTIAIKLNEVSGRTNVSLSQDNNESEEMCAHSQKNWEMVLGKLKHVVEKNTVV